IYNYAKDLVKTGKDIEKEFGIPIVNKRISVTPIALIGAACCKTPSDFAEIAVTLDDVGKEVGVNFIGGYSALVSKGMTKADEMLIKSIPEALAKTDRVCSSINLGSTKTGINMDAVKLMGEIIKETAENTKEVDSLGCAKLVVFCNAPDDNPFMAGAFHGVTEADCIINVGVSGPGVVKTALEKVRGENFEVLCETIKKTAFKVTRVGQLVAKEASQRLNVPFGIVDLSLAPTPAIGDSVADILCEIGLEYAGAPGTTAALALLNDQVKKGGVMASSYVGGLSGAFIPVSEDQGMINAVDAGALTIEKLEAMTCVCSVGLDMIAIPGDTKATSISGIIADELAIGMVNQKTTAVRIIPVIGKGVGETVEFGGLLGHAPIMSVNKFSCDNFINRGGRIPAPIHSFKN
ncbi:MAG: PFL family protein, partial [Lachnospiraceae bacterium]|nr:PFL family protein [Lachnospiraceae bacterium]